jgi:hypothetical protein
MDTGSTGLGFQTRTHAAPDLLNFQLPIPLAEAVAVFLCIRQRHHNEERD